jgi:hypothetical protein
VSTVTAAVVQAVGRAGPASVESVVRSRISESATGFPKLLVTCPPASSR